MSSRTHWLSLLALLGIATVFLWGVFSWISVRDPAVLVGFCNALPPIGFLFVLKSFLARRPHP